MNIRIWARIRLRGAREDFAMFQYFSEESSVEAVNARMASNVNPRLKEVMTCLVKHVHGFIKEVHLSQAEWELAIDFLTRAGQM